MARLPRIVVPGAPHHVTQRGNHRAAVFHCAEDYRVYRGLMAESCRANGVIVWCYCLMPNHVHLVMEPSEEDGLARAVGEAHRRYSGYMNAKQRQTGHLFQGRFNSRMMDEPHALAAIRYVALNPVKAGLVQRADDWDWASTRAALAGRGDELATGKPVLERIPDLQAWLQQEDDIGFAKSVQADRTIGRPLMTEAAIERLERSMNMRLRPKPRGRPAAPEP